MSVNFTLNLQLDTYIVYDILPNLPKDPAGITKRLKGRDIPEDFINQLSKTKGKTKQLNLIKLFLKKVYKDKDSELRKAKKSLEKFWTNINLKLLEKQLCQILAIPCINVKFTCVVSAFFSTSAWYGSTFSVWYKRREHGNLHQIFAMEFVESYVHYYLNNYFCKNKKANKILPKLIEIVQEELGEKEFHSTSESESISKTPCHGLTEYQKWALTEAIAFNVVYMDKNIKQRLWPDINITYDDANYYPQIKGVIMRVGEEVMGG